jgi:imidazolonepropionase-like amidohydrolase
VRPRVAERPAEWWLAAERIWAGPGRWLTDAALPMRGPVAAGGDPVPVRDLPPGARVLALREPLLLPGLQDAHVHAGLVDLRLVRAAGIAAVTDLGGVPGRLTALHTESLDPSSGLPRLDFAGAFLTAPGGYPSDRSWAAPGSWREVHSADDAAVAVAEQVGAVAVKVAMNASAGPVLAPSVLAAVVAAAHTLGRKVVAHVEGEGMTATVLTAGVDVLAHTPWTELLPPDLVRACAEQTVWISSLRIHGPTGRRSARDNLYRFLEAGGTVRFGTDAGNGTLSPAANNAEEITALYRAGLSVDDLLATMTGPMLGRDTEASRFVAGVAPSYLPHSLSPDQIRTAQVLSLDDIKKLEN